MSSYNVHMHTVYSTYMYMLHVRCVYCAVDKERLFVFVKVRRNVTAEPHTSRVQPEETHKKPVSTLYTHYVHVHVLVYTHVHEYTMYMYNVHACVCVSKRTLSFFV